MPERQTFIAEMEQRFGTEEAFGLCFRLETGEVIPAAEYDRRYQHLPLQDKPWMTSMLANGGSGTCCTDYASFIYTSLPGRVQIWGFRNQDNPTSRVAREHIHPDGHDFAIVDYRWIVDPWPRLVALAFHQMVFDLEDPTDALQVADIYGPRNCWRHCVKAEQFALTMKLEE